ncbi:MAG: hypothetical protein ACLQDY_18410 [Streptosporangiaceae bacterium]
MTRSSVTGSLHGEAVQDARRRSRRRGGRRAVALAAAVTAALGTAFLTSAGSAADAPAAARATARTMAEATPDGDTPPGFWYGTDSSYIPIPGSGPYSEPVIGGAYGGYVGMTGNWAVWQGCRYQGKPRVVVWSATDAARASTNFSTYHKGTGTGAYWFMAGPGVDPRYNGTTSEAYAWGQAQAARALSDARGHVNYPVLFMDIELPGNAPNYTPAQDNGWNNVYTSACSGVISSPGIAARVDRADFNGFAAYVTAHSSYRVGVYSAPSIWADIFSTGSASSIPNTYEWTYTADTSSLSNPPSGWCLKGTSTCAQFFGGQTSASKYALMWQWSGGGGTYNGVGDFDQINGNRTP